MNAPSEITSNPSLTVLFVSPTDNDDLCLQAILGHSNWNLLKAHDRSSASAILRQHKVAVVLCERDLMPGTWTDVLEDVNSMPVSPSVIVTSRLADDHLWAEALNLGAWDVLARPFDRKEVLRSVMLAWLHCRHKAATPVSALQMRAAS